MTETSKSFRPTRLLCRLGLPVVVLNGTIILIQLTDAWIAGRLGTTELAAISRPAMVIFVILTAGYGFMTAVTTLVSHAKGANRAKECGQYAWHGIMVAIALSFFSILLWPLAGLLFSGSPNPQLTALESQYFQLSLLALAPWLVADAIASFLFGVQKMIPVLIGSVIGAVTNFILSISLAFGLGGLPELGFQGIAWGTVGAALIEGAFFIWLLLRRRLSEQYATRRIPSGGRARTRLLQIGLPAAAQGAIDTLSWGVLITYLVAVLGETHLAATTIALRCMQFAFLPAEGLSTALLTVVGDALGAGNKQQAKAALKACIKLTAATLLPLGLMFVLFREQIPLLFSTDPQIIHLASTALVFVALIQIFDIFNLPLLHALQGAGDTKWTFKINLAISSVLIAGGGIAAVAFGGPHAFTLIWAMLALYAGAQSVAFAIRWRSGRWVDAMDQ